MTAASVRAALIVRKPEDAYKIRKSKTFARFLPSEVRIFSLTEGRLGLPLNGDQVGSFFHAAERELFDVVVVSRQVPLFDAPSSWALLRRANELVRQGGQLILACCEGNANPASLSVEMLAKRLGTQPVTLKPPYAKLSRLAADCGPLSVVSWYVANHLLMLLDDVAAATMPEDENLLQPSNSFMAELIGANGAPPNDGRARGVEAAKGADSISGPYRHIGGEFSQRIEKAVLAHSYLVAGLLHKAPIMAHIMRTLFPGRRDLVYVDAGGAFGALAAELLLDPQSGVARALVRDIAPQNLRLVRNLYLGFYEHLRQRLRFSLGPVETFGFSPSYDVISFIGSLLYVRKDALDATLERAWAGLENGGALIVHENIQNSSYVADFDKMFSAAALDRLLSRFGCIEYFSGQTGKQIAKNETVDLAVFRVVRKT